MHKQYGYWGKASLIAAAFARVVSLHEETHKETKTTITNLGLKRFDKLKNMLQTPPNIKWVVQTYKHTKRNKVYKVSQLYLNTIFVEKTLLPELNNYDKIASLFNKLV